MSEWARAKMLCYGAHVLSSCNQDTSVRRAKIKVFVKKTLQRKK